MKEKRSRPTTAAARSVLKPLLWIGGFAVAGLLILKLLFNVDFGFFRTTLTLKSTALTLEDIKAVEYLITAEYFGEVIGTARDYLVRRAVPEAEKLLLRLMNETNPALPVLTPMEETLLNAARGTIFKRGGMNPRLVEKLYERAGLLELIKPEFRDNRLNSGFAEAMVEMLLAKRDIAYLARGTVQAGYDLAKLDESGYFLCRETKTVFLRAELDILGKEINPWFIYDPAAQYFVKGFEIISQSGIDFEEDDALDFIKAVKEECRSRLLDDAVKEGLKERARTSAETTLLNLFRMFDRSVEAVRIVSPDEFIRAKNACPAKQ
jgi:hypothetical protein